MQHKKVRKIVAQYVAIMLDRAGGRWGWRGAMLLGGKGLGIHPTQHGRDQLRQKWPKLYHVSQGANLPAEELLRGEQGADYGWPGCYFDDTEGILVLAPEYGGDGKSPGACGTKRAPVATFPAHWAPNDVVLYYGNQFPSRYRGCAFIAFHGSWNGALFPQGGYMTPGSAGAAP